jgi:hypothetical protein
VIEIELAVPTRARATSVIKIIERACSAENLTLALKGTLAKYPGCVHWHFKKGKERGALEVTWWGREHRLWFKVAVNRKGQWIDEIVPRLKHSIESKL